MKWSIKIGCITLLLVVAGWLHAEFASAQRGHLTGSITDPGGDAQEAPRVSVSPDLIKVTIDVDNLTLAAVFSFQPGTLSRTETNVSLYLDTDGDSATGAPGIDSGSSIGANRLGVDYFIQAVSPRGSTKGRVSRGMGPTEVHVGSVDVSFPTVNQLRIAVPLKMIDKPDPRKMRFKAASSQYLDDYFQTPVLDFMPDFGLAPGVLQ